MTPVLLIKDKRIKSKHRGDLIIKKMGKFWNRGWGGGGRKKNPNQSKIQIRTFENRWGGSEFFKKVLISNIWTIWDFMGYIEQRLKFKKV